MSAALGLLGARSHFDGCEYGLEIHLRDGDEALEARAGDGVWVFLEGKIIRTRPLTAPELLSLLNGDPYGAVTLNVHGCMPVRDVFRTPPGDFRAGDQVWKVGDELLATRLLDPERVAAEVLRLLTDKSVPLDRNEDAYEAGLSIEELRTQAEKVLREVLPLQAVTATKKPRRKPGAGRGTAHPYYRKHAVPALALVK